MFKKPKSVKINIKEVLPSEIEYFCKTQEIDKQIILSSSKSWNQELADELEKVQVFYFVALKSGNYDVISGLDFNDYQKKHELKQPQKSDWAKKIIKHFIKSL